MDHPSVALAAFIKRGARVQNHLSRRHTYLGMRYSSEIGGAPPGDMYVAFMTKTSWHAVGKQLAEAHLCRLVGRDLQLHELGCRLEDVERLVGVIALR